MRYQPNRPFGLRLLKKQMLPKYVSVLAVFLQGPLGVFDPMQTWVDSRERNWQDVAALRVQN
jgi:hypothetical protein